ncbi:hypothetical protein [Cellulomonas fengjieae]|uniref:Uncharacterized protein n=1 Tax=Cellulomonas fengjieae TaxID=2819978 RepID=A0ABS3SMB1_9CELL|nr:hypothetical protein [Cellulomonas fengjieae]MBO3086624.1 hypothetical protein [Cellulomonas fengjieae]QVI66527.1 hypothetical protein KG102_02655 [Cellulomonas fengjieae]
MTDAEWFPATCGDMVDAYPSSYEAECPLHGTARALTALTDPDNILATWLPKEEER